MQQEESDLPIVMGVVFGVIALVIALLVGLIGWKQQHVSSGISASSTMHFTDVEAKGDPLVRLYFAVGSADLPATAEGTLASVIEQLSLHPDTRALLSGFHDASGNTQQNAALARDRALAVRAALIIAGIAPERILLQRPALTLGDGGAEEARRVDIRVQAP